MRIIDILKQTKLQHDFVPTDNAGVSLAHCDFGDSTPKQNLNRPLKADGHAGLIAIHMLQYHGFPISIQGAVDLLESHGHVSNDIGRRLREAKSWLKRQGFEIMTTNHTSLKGQNYKGWTIVPNPELQQAALAKLKGKK